MEHENLLKRSSSTYSIPSSGDETLLTSRKRNALSAARLWIEAATLSCLVILICLLAGILKTERGEAQHNDPSQVAGADLSRAVPLDAGAKIIIKPWVKHLWQVPEEEFSDISVLNATIATNSVSVAKLPSNAVLQNDDRLSWSQHTAHCFNYVLDALRCFADSTAEGGREKNP